MYQNPIMQAQNQIQAPNPMYFNPQSNNPSMIRQIPNANPNYFQMQLQQPSQLTNQIYVGDLQPSTTADQVYNYFSRFGPISNFKFGISRNSNCYAFISFYDRKSMENAVNESNHQQLFGSKGIRVTKSCNLKDLAINIFIKNIPSDCDSKQFDEIFLAFGPILTSKLIKNSQLNVSYGYVQYESKASAEKCLNVGKLAILNQEVTISKFIPKSNRSNLQTNLYIKNFPDLPIEKISEILKESFDEKILNLIVKIDKKTDKAYAFINFETPEGATKIKDKLQEWNPFASADSNEKLTVEWFQPTQTQNQTNLVTKNLLQTVNQDELKKQFSIYGTITSLLLISKPNTKNQSAFFSYQNKEEATNAIIESHKNKEILNLYEDKKIYITFVQDKETRKKYLTLIRKTSKNDQQRKIIEKNTVLPPQDIMYNQMMPNVMGVPIQPQLKKQFSEPNNPANQLPSNYPGIQNLTSNFPMNIPPIQANYPINMPIQNMQMQTQNPHQQNKFMGNFGMQEQMMGGNMNNMGPRNFQKNKFNNQNQKRGGGPGNYRGGRQNSNNMNRQNFNNNRPSPHQNQFSSNLPQQISQLPPLPTKQQMLLEKLEELKSRMPAFSTLDPKIQREELGQLLYHFVLEKCNEAYAPKITGMILDPEAFGDINDLFNLMENETELTNTVNEGIKLINEGMNNQG